MPKVKLDISTSLDGFVAGPNPTTDAPLGEGGNRLHEWAFATASFREQHGMEGGETGLDDEIARAHLVSSGVTIMGRRMFSGGEGPWADDANANGWWGDEPPFHHPVFVLTSHAREPLTLGETTFTFVTDGAESALEQAVAVAGDKDVLVAGGADVAQQFLAAGLLDEIYLHVAPALLGAGRRLLDLGVADTPGTLERVAVIESPSGTVHLRYRVVR